MRIVSIAVINGIPQYNNFGGVGDFGETEVIGNLCIGEYLGELGELALPTYPGTWPEPTYRKDLSKTDFKGLFTATEYRAISNLAKTDDNAFQFWDMAQTSDGIDLDDPRTIAGLNYVSGMGAIEAPRLAVIMKGKPE